MNLTLGDTEIQVLRFLVSQKGARHPRVVSRSAEQKQEVYYPGVRAEAEGVRYTIRGFGVLIKNDFEV